MYIKAYILQSFFEGEQKSLMKRKRKWT